ncbi:unnamed protein product [Amaranthus hypochondriacus]
MIFRNHFIGCIIVLVHFTITSAVEFESFLELQQSGNGSSTHKGFTGEGEYVLHVTAYGAVGDGLHDDTEAFKNAWKMACSISWRSTIIIPEGSTYLVRPIDFAGCHAAVTLRILGAIIAPKDPQVWRGLNPRKWLYFHGVKHLTLEGEGTINGMGQGWWSLSCKTNSTIPCHHAPTAITFHRCKNLNVRDISIVDSQQAHMSFTNCRDIVVTNVTVTAPAKSPNTDGIHISASTDVRIMDSSIRTVSNSSRVVITEIECGPGHGISIGSLGRWNEWSKVKDITVDGAYLSNTQNGVRIKTWQGGAGMVSRVKFKNVWMENVSNPIIVDQYYCDSSKPCENQTSAVHIEKISFMGIRGTSASKEAIKFSCSDTSPCQGLYLEDIKLIFYTGTGVTTSFCWNALGSSSGLVHPPSCFPDNQSVAHRKPSYTSHIFGLLWKRKFIAYVKEILL